MIPPNFVEKIIRERPAPTVTHGGDMEPLRWEINAFKAKPTEAEDVFKKLMAPEPPIAAAPLPAPQLSRKQRRKLAEKSR
jgi:hypothetical protein